MEGIVKHNEHQKELEFGDILQQLETFERVYPYFTNMIQHQKNHETAKDSELKSVMKKESID